MDLDAYYRSLADELNAMKDRVRSFIADSHWQTDGEWKESVLKAVLRRHLPSDVAVGRGFVIGNPREGYTEQSKQIDVLLYDSTKPVLFRDGDLVIVPSISVRGIIEVKTMIEKTSELEEILLTLAQNLAVVKRGSSFPRDVQREMFIGLFAYETEIQGTRRSMNSILKQLKSANDKTYGSIINHVSLGEDIFVKFWNFNPDQPLERNYNTWHGYKLDKKAPGYFINNVVTTLSPEQIETNQDLWFPYETRKESVLVAKLSSNG